MGKLDSFKKLHLLPSANPYWTQFKVMICNMEDYSHAKCWEETVNIVTSSHTVPAKEDEYYSILLQPGQWLKLEQVGGLQEEFWEVFVKDRIERNFVQPVRPQNTPFSKTGAQ